MRCSQRKGSLASQPSACNAMREPRGIDADSTEVKPALKRDVGRGETKWGAGAQAPEAGDSTLLSLTEDTGHFDRIRR